MPSVRHVAMMRQFIGVRPVAFNNAPPSHLQCVKQCCELFSASPRTPCITRCMIDLDVVQLSSHAVSLHLSTATSSERHAPRSRTLRSGLCGGCAMNSIVRGKNEKRISKLNGRAIERIFKLKFVKCCAQGDPQF